MNPSQPAGPSSLRRQALMEELRLLEQQQHQHQQNQQQQAMQALARDNLQLQMAGATSLSDLMQAQAIHQGSGGMVRGRGGSIDLSTSGAGDTLIGMNELELSQLQAAMRLRGQQQNARSTSRGSLPGNRGISSGLPTQQLHGGTTSSQFPGRIHDSLLKSPVGFDVVNSIRKRPLDNMWGLGGRGISGGQSSPYLKKQTLAKSKGDLLFGSMAKSSDTRNVVLDGCSFPLPLLSREGGQKKRRRMADRLSLDSYKYFWANSNTSTRFARRELFDRMLHRGNVRILDNSGIVGRGVGRM